jgi:hypothetical protein
MTGAGAPVMTGRALKESAAIEVRHGRHAPALHSLNAAPAALPQGQYGGRPAATYQIIPVSLF